MLADAADTWRMHAGTAGGGPSDAVRRILDELAEFGRRNDAGQTQRARRMLNITPDTGQFLAILVRATRARRILEIGTSNGYSTLWLASAAASQGGRVESIEAAQDKVEMARANFERAGLADSIEVHHGLASDVLGGLRGPYDLVFLDADRANYPSYLEPILRLLRPGGLLVTDNAVSHSHELGPFLSGLRADPRLQTVTVPIGNGEEVTYVQH